jgi:hypothetical protein
MLNNRIFLKSKIEKTSQLVPCLGRSLQWAARSILHSSITAFLDASGGNLRAVQALSRHSNQNTLNLYDDNRRQQQKGASGMLEDLLAGNGGK